jgi:hypothetical protein
MRFSLALAIGVLCAGSLAALATQSPIAVDDEQALLQLDRAAFKFGETTSSLNDNMLDPNVTWTDSFGKTRNKSEILRAIRSGKGLPLEAASANHAAATSVKSGSIKAHSYGQVALIQENKGKIYVLRIWIKRLAGWKLLIYQAVSIGAPVSAEPEKGECENPCNTVPFQPRNADEREVIRAYQAVERAVTAHDSTAWGVHIADEFFAVTSNSDRPIDKAGRMAGLDNQKVAGIAPYPLVSARMFEFYQAMVMTSRQQPKRGLPLRVTRVWFKRNGAWLEAYSYQTTIQESGEVR